MTLSNLRALTALLLLGLSIPALAQVYARVFTVWRGPEAAGPRRVLLGALGAAAIVRWFVAPRWIVTIYIGYLLTAQAIELSALSHYGMGSLALYHALFAIFPRDHRTLLFTNAVVSVLTLPLSATFAARLLRDRRTGAIFALLAALVPLFIKNDNSDANNVPCLWWLFGGLVLWEAYLDTGHRLELAGAAVLLASAAGGRPEMPVLVPILVALFTFGLAPSRARLRDPALLVAALAAALLLAPHAIHVFSAVSVLEERDSLPGVAHAGFGRIVDLVIRLDTVARPSLFPVALLPLAVAGLVRKDGPWRPRLALIVAATLAIAIYGLDLCRANMARVHVPGALFVTMLAAAGIAALWAHLKHPALRALLPIAVVATAVPTVRTLWAPTNEQAEDDFIRAAMKHLPSDPYTLVRFDRADRASPGATHDHFPDYLFRPPMGPGRVSSVLDWTEQPELDRPAFFYLGMRCYAEFRGEGTPPPHGDALQPACARMRERFSLEPVLEETVPNRGDVWLEYYGDAPELRLGLYRIRPLTTASVR